LRTHDVVPAYVAICSLSLIQWFGCASQQLYRSHTQMQILLLFFVLCLFARLLQSARLLELSSTTSSLTANFIVFDNLLASMTVLSILKEIQSVRHFFASREGKENNTLQKSFADSVLNKLKLVKDFGPGEGAKLNDALKGSPFGEAQTQRIWDAVDSLLEANAKMTCPSWSAGGSTSVSKQFLKCWWNYFSKSEFDFLMDPNKSLHGKMTTIVERGNRCGCNNADEQTWKWSMAVLLLCHYKVMPEAHHIYEKLQDFKKVWTCESKAWALEHLVDFPETPSQLPRDIFEAAYDPDDPPVSVKLPGINTVAELIPLRKNSKLLKQPLKKAAKQELADAFAEAHVGSQLTAEPVSPVKAESASPVKAATLLRTGATVKLEEDSLDDPEEVAIMKEAEAKIARHRVARRAALPEPAAAAPGGLIVERNADGSLVLHRKPKIESKPSTDERTSRLESKLSESTVKVETPVTAETPVNAAPMLHELDPWTLAAITSLRQRNESKKALNKASSEKKRPAASNVKTEDDDDDEDDDADDAKKKPASKCKTAIKQEPAAMKSGMKRPAAATDDADEVPKARILQSMPKLPSDGSSPKPVKYWGGIIYTARKAKKFRALKVRGNVNTEASSSWGGDTPTKAAWAKCVAAIEAHHR